MKKLVSSNRLRALPPLPHLHDNPIFIIQDVLLMSLQYKSLDNINNILHLCDLWRTFFMAGRRAENLPGSTFHSWNLFFSFSFFFTQKHFSVFMIKQREREAVRSLAREIRFSFLKKKLTFHEISRDHVVENTCLRVTGNLRLEEPAGEWRIANARSRALKQQQ